MRETTTGAIGLGTGRLSWPRSERVSDRYGTVMLMFDGDSMTASSGYVSFGQAPVGRRGRLTAEILEVRESTHIGDLFRALVPGGAVAGETVVLGEGTLFRDAVDDIPIIGLRPDDGRDFDWLDPAALYRCHEQTVSLAFEPL